MEKARELFDEMLNKGMLPDKTAYASLIDGNLKRGNIQEALDLQKRMAETSVDLDVVVYTSLILGPL